MNIEETNRKIIVKMNFLYNELQKEIDELREEIHQLKKDKDIENKKDILQQKLLNEFDKMNLIDF